MSSIEIISPPSFISSCNTWWSFLSHPWRTFQSLASCFSLFCSGHCPLHPPSTGSCKARYNIIFCWNCFLYNWPDYNLKGSSLVKIWLPIHFLFYLVEVWNLKQSSLHINQFPLEVLCLVNSTMYTPQQGEVAQGIHVLDQMSSHNLTEVQLEGWCPSFSRRLCVILMTWTVMRSLPENSCCS